jgi:glutaredoxin
MEQLARRILESFDGSGRDALELQVLAERAGAATPAERDALRAALAQLVEQGLLRPTDGDAFARTEDGRLAVAGPLDVTLYSRPGCHLCDEAREQMAPLLRQFGARLRVVNIDEDPALRARHTNDVPVIFLGARKVAKHRLDPAQFRRQLEAASKMSS